MFNVPLLKGGVDARLSNTVGDVASAVEIVVLSYLRPCYTKQFFLQLATQR